MGIGSLDVLFCVCEGGGGVCCLSFNFFLEMLFLGARFFFFGSLG